MHDAAIRLRHEVINRALDGPGRAGSQARRAAFENQGVDARARVLIDKVARQAWTVTDRDVAAAKAEGLSEDEIFELVVCAALGQSARQLDAALAALHQATGSGRPLTGEAPADAEAAR
jgi:hypothetical protein